MPGRKRMRTQIGAKDKKSIFIDTQSELCRKSLSSLHNETKYTRKKEETQPVRTQGLHDVANATTQRTWITCLSSQPHQTMPKTNRERKSFKETGELR